MRTVEKFFGGWRPGQKLDFGSNCGKWNDQAMVKRPDGDGPGIIKRIIPTIDTKIPNLVGVEKGVIQFCAMTEGFIHNQNVCLVGGRVIPGCGSRHNRNT